MKQQRMTKQKQLVLDVAKSHCDHPTADELYLEVRSIDNRISRGTVYRNLEQLADSGLLMHVKVPGADRFDSRIDYHYHMLCKNCRKVCDAPIDYRYEPDEEIFEKTGFKVERHRTIFEGLCPDCLKMQKANKANNYGVCGHTKVSRKI